MKIIKILVSALFVCAFSVQGTLNVSAGMSCDTIATDSGTGHYLVTTSADLLAMSCNIIAGDADYRTGIYDLQNNIDMTGVNWVPIGTVTYPFGGEFNGNDHVINHLSITAMTTHGSTYNGFQLYGAGLFGYVEGGDIHNLGLYNAYIDLSTNVLTIGQTQLLDISFVGVLAASVDLSTSIDSVLVRDASIEVTNPSMMEPTTYSWPFTYVGGIVGRLAGLSQIVHSKFTGTINVTVSEEDDQSVYLGGLAGGVETSGIEESWFIGDITFNSPADYELDELVVGGIAGYAFYSGLTDAVAEDALIDVTSDTVRAAIGGIAGTVDAITVVEQSTFMGEIDSDTDNVGGLIGFVQEATVVPNGITPQNGYILLVDTNNVKADITGHDNVGGLIGKIYYDTDIENSWFEGDIHGHVNVGGLVGYSTDCHVMYGISYSLGTLTGVNYLGGITGNGYSENDIMNVFSRMGISIIPDPETVPVDVPLYYAGGIFGFDYGDFSYYQYVYFAGVIVNNSGQSFLIDPISNFGALPDSGNIIYYDHTLMPITSSIGNPMDTDEMKYMTGYEGFNFAEIWFLDSRFNGGYAFFDAGFFRIIFDDGIHPFGYLSRPWINLDPPTPPTKPGFVFGGWYTDQQFTHPWDFNADYVQDDVTLYAKWTAEIPDTGVEAGYGVGLLGIGLSLWFVSRKSKKQS